MTGSAFSRSSRTCRLPRITITTTKLCTTGLASEVHEQLRAGVMDLTKIAQGSCVPICYGSPVCDPVQVNIANIFVNLGRVFKFFAAQPRC